MFEESNKVGKIGENKTKQLFNDKTKYQLLDVSDLDEFREKDIDFILFLPNHQYYKLEVKTDTKSLTTNNIIYEISSGTNKGCFDKTQADYILYYLTSPAMEIIKCLVINVKRLRAYKDLTKGKWDMTYKCGDNLGTQGIKMNIPALELSGVIQKIINF